MNSEKLRNSARTTFKNPNFQFLYKLEKKLEVQNKTNIQKFSFLIWG